MKNMLVEHFQLILFLAILALSYQYSFGIDETKSKQQKNDENEMSIVNDNYDHLMVDFLHSYFKPKQESGNGNSQLTPYEMNLLQSFINMLLQKGIGQEGKKHKKTHWHLRQGR